MNNNKNNRIYAWLAVFGAIAIVSFFVTYIFSNGDDNSKNNILIVSIALTIGSIICSIIAAKIFEIVNQKMELQILLELAKIQSYCAESSVTITTIKKFLLNSKEDHLNDNDEVLILTNSLKSYDMTEPAIKTITLNILDGVKYIYFVPNDNAYSIQREAFLKSIKEELKKESTREKVLADSHINSILKNLVFHVLKIDDSLLFNFAIVKNKNALAGYWYLTKPMNSYQSEEGNDLIILKLDDANLNRLDSVFNGLKKISTRI